MPPLAPVTSATEPPRSVSMGSLPPGRRVSYWTARGGGGTIGEGGPPVFEVAYETTFCATHVLTDAGRPIEPVHGHDWRVEVVAAGESLDRLGVVVDFEHLKEAVGEVCRRFHYKDLHAHPACASPAVRCAASGATPRTPSTKATSATRRRCWPSWPFSPPASSASPEASPSRSPRPFPS